MSTYVTGEWKVMKKCPCLKQMDWFCFVWFSSGRVWEPSQFLLSEYYCWSKFSLSHYFSRIFLVPKSDFFFFDFLSLGCKVGFVVWGFNEGEYVGKLVGLWVGVFEGEKEDSKQMKTKNLFNYLNFRVFNQIFRNTVVCKHHLKNNLSG